MVDTLTRNTNVDWNIIGQEQPFWGVLVHPDFRTENITPQAIDSFYESGRVYVDHIKANLERFLGTGPLTIDSALDIGCGVGRLTEAMNNVAARATGYDISQGMLEVARSRGKARYVDVLPDEQFDWINSYIVFQHIPPSRGLELLQNVLSRTRIGSVVTLHLTVWRDGDLPDSPNVAQRDADASGPSGAISMYYYNLSSICQILNMSGILTMMMMSENHSGANGVTIYGRRDT